MSIIYYGNKPSRTDTTIQKFSVHHFLKRTAAFNSFTYI